MGSYLYENDKVTSEYNIETARSILQNNGWTFNKKVWQKTVNRRTLKLKFNLVVNSSNESRVAVAENIKNSLAELGIQINIIKANESQYNKYLENKNYDIILTGVYSGYSPDLSSYFGENNLANYNNETTINLITEINNITDEKLLREKYNELINIYKEDIPYIFLYYNRNNLICNPNLRGNINPNNYNLYFNIEAWYRQ